MISVVSMRISCRNPSIMLRNTYYPDRYLSWEHVRTGILYSCMCDKIGVCVCVCVCVCVHYAANLVP